VITTLRSPVFLCASALAGGLLLASTAVAMTPPQLSRAAGYSGNPVAGNQGFGVVVEKNAMLGGTESEGPIAIGGDLSFGPGYNVSLHDAGSFTVAGDAHPTALLVNGSVDLAGSSPSGVLRVLSNGYLKLGSLSGARVLNTDSNGASVNTRVVATGASYDSVPHIELTTQQPLASVGPHPGLIDFDALFAAYRDRSTAMAACPTNVTLLDGNAVPLPDQKVIPSGSNIKIHLAAGQTNVLHLTGEMLNNIAELNFLDQPSSSGPLLIVVDTTGTGGVLSWHTPNMAGLQKTAIPSLLWNFPDATNITVASGDSIEGTVYAPRAHLTDIDPSNIEGDIIVRSLEHNGGELHYFPFTATIACTTVDPTTSPTPTPTPTPATSPTPTPTPTPPTSPAPPHAPVPSADHSPDTPAPSGDEDVPGAPDHNRHDGGKNDRPGLAASGADPTQLTAALAAVALSALGAGVLVLVRRGRRRRHG
jgi:choice-of-anchor A domain-containing protein